MAALKFGDKILTSAGGTPLWAYTCVEIAGVKYRTVRLGGLEWLAEGLRYLPAGYTLFDLPNDASTSAPDAKDGIRNCVSTRVSPGVYDPLSGYNYSHYAPDTVESDLTTIAPGWRIPAWQDFLDTFAITGGLQLTDGVASGEGLKNWRANGGLNGNWTVEARNTFGLNYVRRGWNRGTNCWSIKADASTRYSFLLADRDSYVNIYKIYGPTTDSQFGGVSPIRLVRDIT